MTRVRVQGLKSHVDTGVLPMAPLTVLVGPNNSGKSSILRAISYMQDGFKPALEDVRLGAQLKVEVTLTDFEIQRWRGGTALQPAPSAEITCVIEGPGSQPRLHISDAGRTGDTIGAMQSEEPYNFIYPYLSKRKVTGYDQAVNKGLANMVATNLRYIVAKIDRASNPAHPSYDTFVRMCRETIGFPLTTFASEAGKKVGIYVDSFQTISLEEMGEGVASVAGLIAELCVADGNLFLIEEIENDVHPRALKSLLDLVIAASDHNQFVVSTHSNIVLRTLGSTDESVVIYVDMRPDSQIPESVCSVLSAAPEDRIRVLRDLGYEPYDFDLWDGWLILEESSAERIIRDYLIPLFAPELRRIRLLAAGGVDRVTPTFEDFNRLFRFTHLENLYHGRAWVIVDGDSIGRSIVERLRSAFSTWSKEHFLYWPEPAFERFYPAEFHGSVEDVLAIKDRRERRRAKAALLEEVRAWLDEDSGRAEDALRQSASPVIDVLTSIEASLVSVQCSGG